MEIKKLTDWLEYMTCRCEQACKDSLGLYHWQQCEKCPEYRECHDTCEEITKKLNEYDSLEKRFGSFDEIWKLILFNTK